MAKIGRSVPPSVRRLSTFGIRQDAVGQVWQELEALDDVYDSVGKAHGGWLAATAAATDPKDFGGKRYGVPFGTSGNVINRRDDLLSAAGFKDPPQTWEELAKMAAACR